MDRGVHPTFVLVVIHYSSFLSRLYGVQGLSFWPMLLLDGRRANKSDHPGRWWTVLPDGRVECRL